MSIIVMYTACNLVVEIHYVCSYSIRFNRKPSEGLKFLQSNNLLGQSPTEIAIFFHTDDRIDKIGIGEYLGDNDLFHKQVNITPKVV